MEDNILILLDQQSENFPVMKSFITEKGLNPTILFLPQTLKGLAEEMTHRNELMIECFNYLDLVKIYSFITYDDSERFTDNLIKIITNNRFVKNEKLIANREATDDFLFTSEEEMKNFVDSNKYLIPLYIYSMIGKIFYKQTS